MPTWNKIKGRVQAAGLVYRESPAISNAITIRRYTIYLIESSSSSSSSLVIVFDE